MVKKISGSRLNRPNQDNDKQIQAGVHYIRHAVQEERWKHEHEYNLALEEQLAGLSRLSYQPVDYQPLLERQVFVERSIPNFDHLPVEAKLKVEESFIMPLATKGGGLVVGVIAMLLSNSNALFLGATFVVNVFLAVSIYLTAQDRQKAINRAVAEAEDEAQRRRTAIVQQIEAEKAEHDKKEDERIGGVERLLAGERSAILARLDDVLSKMVMPSPIELNIDILNNTLLVRIWLPNKIVIPTHISSLSSSGRVRYEQKEPRQINKQYIEVCAAIVMQVISCIYENIPSIDKSYFQGFSKGDTQDDCLIDMIVDRNIVATICRSNSGLAAVRAADGSLICDTNLVMEPVKPSIPEGWSDDKIQLIHGLTIRIYK